MKTVKTFKIILFAFVMASGSAIGQERPASESCKQLVMGYLQRMEAINAPEEGEVYHVKYRMKTQFPKESGIASTETDTEVLSTKNRLAMYDKKMQVFGDDKNIFVVVPEHRKIYWSLSDPKIFNDANTHKKFMALQRSLLNSAAQISCVDKEGLTVVRVRPGKDFASKTRLVEQTITYDIQKERVVKVENLYGKTSKIKKQSIVYEILDFKSRKKITAPVAALFHGKELKSAYKGFEIIDNRQKR